MIETPTLEWSALAPELVTGIASMLVLLLGMSRRAWSRASVTLVTLAALVAAATMSVVTFHTGSYGAFVGQINSDEITNVARLIALASAAVATVLAVRGRADDGRHGEFHALLLAAVCGMGLMAGAGSFVTLFIGLELLSIALYVLCALDAERVSSLEAGLKYLLVGGMSSAVLLYGVALTYGATGSLSLAEIGSFDGTRGMLLLAGAALVVGGLLFKVSAAPMHWWTPDVYEGAPTPVTAFMSVATKAVALLALARVLVVAYLPEADRWMPVIAVVAVVSMLVGNLGALAQGHLKRVLAYSSIAQAGYLLCAVVGHATSGVAALVYALIVYAAMTLGAFTYVLVLERELGRDATWADLAGRGWVGEQQPLWHTLPALGLTVCALALAGIPPTAGFFSKFGVFAAAVEADYGWLAVAGALTSVISLGYYLRIPVELYMRSPDAARATAEAATLPAASTGPSRPAGTRMPVATALGVLLALLVLVLAYAPGRAFDAGCSARSALVTGGPCVGVDRIDAAAATVQ